MSAARGPQRAARLAAGLLLAVAGTGGRLPSLRIEVFNHSGAEALIVSVYNDGSSATRALADGESGSFGRALTWHVFSGDARRELLHPGTGFRSAGWLGGETYRFQIEPGGCVFALSPGQRAPVRELPVQPRGYPIGPETCAANALSPPEMPAP